MPQITLSPKAARACQKYSLDTCLAAFALHQLGYGARGVALEGPSSIRTTRQADAAIDAGREYTVFTTGSDRFPAKQLRVNLHSHLSALATCQTYGRPYGDLRTKTHHNCYNDAMSVGIQHYLLTDLAIDAGVPVCTIFHPAQTHHNCETDDLNDPFNAFFEPQQ